VGVYRGIACGSGEVFAISVGDVFAGLGVAEALGKAEVDHVHVVLFLADANQEVVRLDVSVQEVSAVDELDSLKLNYKVRRP